MKKYLLIFLFANTTFALKNSSYIEIGGAGYLMTLNYERMLTEKIITRVGYGSHESDNKINFFPIGTAYLIDLEGQIIEIGGGMTFLNGTLQMRGENLEPNTKMIYFGGGYRNILRESRLLLNLKGYYLFLGEFSSPWAGISFGWKF